MNRNIVPGLISSEVRKGFADNIEAWRNFAQRITKNPYVKSFLLERDGNYCSWCKGQFLKPPIIHHTSYEHYCSYNITIRIPALTLNNPFKTRLIPDYKKCKEENNAR